MRKTLFFSFLLVIPAFVFSYFVGIYYVNGDQSFYRPFYEDLSKYDFYEGFLLYQSSLGSIEPVYYVLTYFSSSFLSKDVYISTVNSLLMVLLYVYLRRVGARWWFYPFVFTNFYLMVLLFAAERLKFGAFFLLLYASGVLSNGMLFVPLAFFSHIQTLIFVPVRIFSSLGAKYESSIFNSWSTRILISFLLLCSIFFLRDQILYKLPFYLENGGYSDIIKPLIFSSIGYVCAAPQEKRAANFAQIPVIFACFFFGSERLAMVSYIIMIHYFIRSRKFSILGFSTLVYFSVMGLLFVLGIFERGTGFAG